MRCARSRSIPTRARLAELRERFAELGLGLAPDKTRLIEFGRFAAERRAARGLRDLSDCVATRRATSSEPPGSGRR